MKRRPGTWDARSGQSEVGWHVGESGYAGAWRRRGLAPASELGGAAIVSNATPMTVPAVLLKSTIQAVAPGHEETSATAGVVSASVSAIAEGVLRVMLWTKIKTMVALILVMVVSGAGLGLLALGANDKRPTSLDVAGQATVEATVTPPAVLSKLTGDETPSRPRSLYQVPEPILVIDDSSATKVWARNPETKAWHTYTAPMGVRIFKQGQGTSRDLVALGANGEAITEVAAFSIKSGKWVRQVLIEPAQKDLYPVTTNHVAAYFIGRHAYAFSSLTGQWSHQTLNEPASEAICHRLQFPVAASHPLLGSEWMIYTADHRAYAFSALSGKWEVLDMKQGATARASFGPSGTALVNGEDRLYSFDPKTGRFQEIEAVDD